MDQKLENLLNKINLSSFYLDEFKNASIKKIRVIETQNTWVIYLHNNKNIKYEALNEFIQKISSYVKGKYIYKLIIDVDEEDLSLLDNFYKNILIILNNNNFYYNMFSDRLINKDNTYYIEVYNKQEYNTINTIIDKINEYLSSFGFTTKLSIYENKEKSKETLEEISKDKEYILKPQKDIKPSGIIYGNAVKGKITPLNEITYEVDNITIEVQVFGVVPSNKKDYYSLSLKVTDFTTSMYVRIYANNSDSYNNLLNKIKEGMWLKINGYVKNNKYYNDLVINARNVEIIEKEIIVTKDEEEVKRVELHTHTMMSQMDGVVTLKDLVNRAKTWGHKAIAITDHNAIQTFPEASKYVTDDFKIIYGAELNMIDDDINLVVRPDDSMLLENTYVVFDFETTGFNAGGGDSIIEIGAVKLKDGEIIDRFDRLINPGRKLSPHISELTNITDEMLKDCPNEESAVKEFIKWTGNLPMVAHNAKFDSSFLEMAYNKYNLGEYKNPLLDTLQLSRAIDPDQSRHSLSILVKRYDVPFDENAHHRGDYDAEATALIFHKMLLRLDKRKIEKMNQITELVSKEDIHKFGELYHTTILVKNQTGLKNLFKLISYANTKYLYKTSRILKSVIEEYREGLLIGSSCANGEIFRLARSKSDEEIENLMDFYDYIELQPPEVYKYLIDLEDFKNENELIENIKKIIECSQKKEKLVVATSDVHHLDREDKIYREIIVNQKVPGGGRHPLNRKEIKQIPSMHFRTTTEMLNDFKFLGKEKAYEIVVTSTNIIENMIEKVTIVPDTKGIPFSPKFDNSVEQLKSLVYEKAHSIYGNPLPKIVEDRLESELNGIINGGFDTIYLIAQRLVKKSNDDGYVVGSRGSVGSSLVATMLGITEVNSLPAHYVCPNCKKSIFEENGRSFGIDYASGYDLPDKICTCGTKFNKEGQDMPFATFLGFNADKVPDIDLNFSGEYQPRAHEYTKVLFGEDNVYRAGTIGTVAEKTAFGFVKGYFEDRGIEGVSSLEVERLAKGVTGVKRTTGQHPGGIVVVPDYKEIFDFTPFQYPADMVTAEWRTTHFNYHDIESCLLKLDILGHDNPTIFKMLKDLTGIDPVTIPMDDKEVMSLFTSTKALNVTPEQIESEVGCVGLPEFTKFVIGIVLQTKPTTFAELVKISGLSHGTDVWNGNAEELVKNNICPFKEVIGCRDDIMVYLSNHGIKPLDAFKIMELVRKGKQVKEKEKWDGYKKLLRENKIPEWYINSCDKIKYMFPKAHATAYVSAAFRIGWYKINRAIEYYAVFFSVKCFSFDLDCMESGYTNIKEKLDDLNLRKFSLSVKEQDLISTLEVALEMTARGYKFGRIDLLKSDSMNFVIDEDRKTLIPPFRALDGLGDVVAKNIIEERKKGEFISIEDLQKRAKISSTIIENMKAMGILKGLPLSSQLSLFENI